MTVWRINFVLILVEDQFPSSAWIDSLRRVGVRISMDGKGRFLDSIFIERLWRTPKYECVYLHAWATGSEARSGLRNWLAFYNGRRLHSAHGGQPPAVV